MSKIDNLEPKDVFRYFEEISSIPRGSGNIKQISDYLVDFAKKQRLDFIQESCGNVIIKKPASEGYDHIGSVMLQGHMDMVCEKNNDKIHDFENDPLTLVIKDDFLYADNTTLGADNGIALAYIMSVLADNNLKHPRIEAVFTVDEETTMQGAQELAVQNLDAMYMINLDTENEDEMLLSCAGGAKSLLKLPIYHTSLHGNSLNAIIKVRGLKGGHSGLEIHQNRGNSNIIMGRILNELNGRIDFEMISINGGSKNNAIPRECDASLVINEKNKKELEEIIRIVEKEIYLELKGIDDEFRVDIEYTDEKIDKVLSEVSKQKIINILMIYSSGVSQMSLDIPGLVESSNNVGVVSTKKDMITINCAVRSSIDSHVEYILKKHQAIANLSGAILSVESVYPGWKYNKNSRLRTIFVDTYKELNKKNMNPEAIHAGLECGIIAKKMPDLDIISFGPNMYDIHTPNEHLSISSTKRVYEYLVKGLENMIKIK